MDLEHNRTGSIQDGQILTCAEAAKYLGVSILALRDSRYSNKLCGRKSPKHIKLNHRTIVYRRTTLDEWLNSLEEFETASEARSAIQK